MNEQDAIRGRFITFEGIDGAGKSTHIGYVTALLKAAGKTVVSTREPGGTPLGERLREVLLHERMHLETEALLMFAGRREHIAEVIQPALDAGDWVVSDRFTDATFAYQGGGRGLAIDRLEALERWVQQGLQPTKTILFDLAPEIAAARLADARTPDKFEAESAQFFLRTRAEYLRRAAAEPDRFVVLNANRERTDIQKDLENLLATL